MGLLSGLESLGLGDLKEKEVFEKEAPKVTESGTVVPVAEKTELDVLFDKTFKCPVCNRDFTSKMIRAGKNKLLKQDTDLRGIYDTADVVKYDAILCPHCGFAALNRFFKPLPTAQEKLIRDKICINFKGVKAPEGEYSYDDAILRYKLALACTIVKCGKNSEKAYVCLKLAWTYRGKAEHLPADTENRDAVLKQLKAAELECLQNAYEGFNAAFSTEPFPMCGMDETTVMYISAEVARRIGKLDEAGRLASSIITSRVAGERIKEKAREIKELVKKQKEAQAGAQ